MKVFSALALSIASSVMMYYGQATDQLTIILVSSLTSVAAIALVLSYLRHEKKQPQLYEPPEFSNFVYEKPPELFPEPKQNGETNFLESLLKRSVNNGDIQLSLKLGLGEGTKITALGHEWVVKDSELTVEVGRKREQTNWTDVTGSG